jgi:hypothetical protein
MCLVICKPPKEDSKIVYKLYKRNRHGWFTYFQESRVDLTPGKVLTSGRSKVRPTKVERMHGVTHGLHVCDSILEAAEVYRKFSPMFNFSLETVGIFELRGFNKDRVAVGYFNKSYGHAVYHKLTVLRQVAALDTKSERQFRLLL